jgi:hypothetical protein
LSWKMAALYSNITTSAFAMSWTIHISSMELSRMKKPRRHIGYVVAQVCDLRFDRIIGIWEMSLSACYSVFCFGCDVTAQFWHRHKWACIFECEKRQENCENESYGFFPSPILSSTLTGVILESLSQTPERSVWTEQMHLAVFFVLSLYLYVATETIFKYS